MVTPQLRGQGGDASWLSVFHANHAGNTFDSDSEDVFGFDANERCGLRKQLRTEFAAEANVEGKNVVSQEANDAEQDVARKEGVDGQRNGTGLPARKQRGVVAGKFEGNVRAGVPTEKDSFLIRWFERKG